MHKLSQQGFTLLEVLVALVILTLTMSGLVTSIGDGASNQSALEERTFAQWVALNQVAKMQLEQPNIKKGNKNGVEEMAGRAWSWKQKIESTSDPHVHRIIVTVDREERDSELARTIGYLWAK